MEPLALALGIVFTSMPAERLNPGDFLCERCGYVLNGLKRADACPECGKPIEQSHPDSKPGSPWQQGLRLGVWRNLRLFARHPRRAFDIVQVEGKRSRQLEADSVAWASGLLALHVTVRGVLVAIDETAPIRHVALFAVCAPVLAFLLFALVLLMLTSIERRGIRIFSKVHHRRITPDVAETIVAHAAVGWVVAAVLVWAAWPAGALIAWLAQTYQWALWELALVAPALLPWLGFFAGLLCFEGLVYAGVLRLRYANSATVADKLNNPGPFGS